VGLQETLDKLKERLEQTTDVKAGVSMLIGGIVEFLREEKKEEKDDKADLLAKNSDQLAAAVAENAPEKPKQEHTRPTNEKK